MTALALLLFLISPLFTFFLFPLMARPASMSSRQTPTPYLADRWLAPAKRAPQALQGHNATLTPDPVFVKFTIPTRQFERGA
jgi:hypothetical protein